MARLCAVPARGGERKEGVLAPARPRSRREAGRAAAFGVVQRKEGEAKENREKEGEDRGHTPAAPLLTVAGEPPVRAWPSRRRRFGELRKKGRRANEIRVSG